MSEAAPTKFQPPICLECFEDINHVPFKVKGEAKIKDQAMGVIFTTTFDRPTAFCNPGCFQSYVKNHGDPITNND